VSPKPIYWKPKYPTRRMRERAFINQQVEREQALERVPRGPGLWARLRARLSRR
jgi:hypothetical protein